MNVRISAMLIAIVILFFSLSLHSPALMAAGSQAGDEKALAGGNNEFAIELYKVLSKNSGNLFFSPSSISTALAMTYAGARKKTAEEMARVLHFTLKGAALHQAFGAMIKKMNEAGQKGTYSLSIANRLWGQKGCAFLPEFVNEKKTYYNAPIELLDFAGGTEKSRLTINGWVEKMTSGKIQDLLQAGIITRDTRLVLTNAIYFRANWEKEFKKDMTAKEPFFVSAQDKREVDMMHKQGEKLRYAKTEDAALLELPYKGSELSMVVLLPDKIDGLRKLEDSLTTEKLDTMLQSLSRHGISVSFPRFKTSAELVLNETLSALGMKDAFNSGVADFSGMTGDKTLAISTVVHKAFVAVDEEGTEAAAATAVVMYRGGACPENIPFRVDHPFIFLIRDNHTGSILFMGRIVDPGK